MPNYVDYKEFDAIARSVRVFTKRELSHVGIKNIEVWVENDDEHSKAEVAFSDETRVVFRAIRVAYYQDIDVFLEALSSRKKERWANEIKYLREHDVRFWFLILHEIGHILKMTAEQYQELKGMDFRTVSRNEYMEIPWDSEADTYAFERIAELIEEANAVEGKA